MSIQFVLVGSSEFWAIDIPKNKLDFREIIIESRPGSLNYLRTVMQRALQSGAYFDGETQAVATASLGVTTSSSTGISSSARLVMNCLAQASQAKFIA